MAVTLLRRSDCDITKTTEFDRDVTAEKIDCTVTVKKGFTVMFPRKRV